jgi:hypothetical protein
VKVHAEQVPEPHVLTEIEETAPELENLARDVELSLGSVAVRVTEPVTVIE